MGEERGREPEGGGVTGVGGGRGAWRVGRSLAAACSIWLIMVLVARPASCLIWQVRALFLWHDAVIMVGWRVGSQVFQRQAIRETPRLGGRARKSETLQMQLCEQANIRKYKEEFSEFHVVVLLIMCRRRRAQVSKRLDEEGTSERRSKQFAFGVDTSIESIHKLLSLS